MVRRISTFKIYKSGKLFVTFQHKIQSDFYIRFCKQVKSSRPIQMYTIFVY